MPHVHSAEKAAARRLRASEKGFIVDKNRDHAHILVPSAISRRVKDISKSLELHGNHCSLLGRNVHFAAAAAVAAKPIIGKENTQKALVLHRSANRAKHNWADMSCENNEDVLDESDPVFIADPWSDAVLPSCDVAPPDGGVDDPWCNWSCYAPFKCMEAEAEPFVPWSAIPVSTGNADSLTQAQNDTIASLLQELSYWRPSPVPAPFAAFQCGEAPNQTTVDSAAMEEVLVLKAQVNSASRNLSQLASSLGSAIESSLSVRLPEKLVGYASMSDLKGQAEDVRQLVLDVAQTQSQSLFVEVGNMIKNVLGDSLLESCEKTFAKLAARLKADQETMRQEIQELEASLRAEFAVSRGAEVFNTSACASSLPRSLGSATQADHKDNAPHDIYDVSVDTPAPRPESQPSSEVAESLTHTFYVGDHVRLHCLKTATLNGKVGVICDDVVSSGRYGVLLHGHSTPKAFLPKNLLCYEHEDDDICTKCDDILNLNAFPPCSCSLTHSNTPAAVPLS